MNDKRSDNEGDKNSVSRGSFKSSLHVFQASCASQVYLGEKNNSYEQHF